MILKRRNSVQRKAFTLIEVLLAVAIFAIVLGAINTVFYSALKLRNKTSELLDKSVPTEQAIKIIKRDLANLVPPSGPLTGQLQSTPTTNAIAGVNGPIFYCASGSIDEINPWPDVQKVAFTLVQSTNRFEGYDLVRVVDRNVLAPTPSQPVSQKLMGGVDQIAFQFFDGSQWQNTWDSTLQTPSLPKAIKMQIQLLQDRSVRASAQTPIEIVVPVMVEARTNSTTTSTNSTEQT
ncbi:MAG: type II secretion system protein GspJ [Verrucomicrobiota bacterium]